MGIVSRYFERLAGLLRPMHTAAEAISADVECLRIGGVRLAWKEVRRLDVYKRDIYTGDLLCLAILVAENGVVEINEEMRGWNGVGDAIERYLPGSLPYAEWAFQIIAAKPGDSLKIYPTSRIGSDGQLS